MILRWGQEMEDLKVEWVKCVGIGENYVNMALILVILKKVIHEDMSKIYKCCFWSVSSLPNADSCGKLTFD